MLDSEDVSNMVQEASAKSNLPSIDKMIVASHAKNGSLHVISIHSLPLLYA